MKISKTKLKVISCSIFFSLFMFSGFLSNFLGISSLGYLFLGISITFFTFFINLKFIKNFLLLSCVIFCFILFQYFVSNFQFYSFNDSNKVSNFTLIVLFLALSASFFGSHLDRIDTFVKYFIYVSFSVLLIFLIKNGLSLGSSVDRLGQGDSNPIWISRLAGILFIYSFVYFLNSMKFINVIFMIFTLFVMFMTGSRGPLISLVLTSVIFLLICSNYNFNDFFKKFSLFFIPILLIPFLPSNVFDRIGRLFNGGFDNNDYYRMELLQIAYNLFLDHPLGRGLGSFVLHSPHSYPHNILLEILAELGIVFFIFFIFFVLFTYIKGYFFLRNFKNDELFNSYSFIYLLGFFGLCNAMFSGDLTSPKEFYFSLFFIFLIIFNSKFKFFVKG